MQNILILHILYLVEKKLCLDFSICKNTDFSQLIPILQSIENTEILQIILYAENTSIGSMSFCMSEIFI